MNNITKIFVDRINRENSTRATYNKYIFNSHLIMFLVITAGAIMINYSSWLKSADELNIRLVMLLVLTILGFLLTRLKVKTFIEEADIVFLLPLEESYHLLELKLARKTIFTKVIISALFIVPLVPIINKLGYDILQIAIFVIWLLVTITQTSFYKFSLAVYSKSSIKDELLVALPYLTLALYFSFGILEKTVFAFVMLFLIGVLFVKTKKIEKNNKAINWYGASEHDSERKERYLKFVSMFVDVPLNSVKVSRRKYFDVLLPKLTERNFAKENSYYYYYIRVFLRQQNTVFLVLRLMLVALLIMVSLKNSYASAVIIVAYSYLTVIQLTPLYKKINASIWSYILPVAEQIKINSFKKLLHLVMGISTLVLVLVAVLINGLEIVILASIVVASFLIKYFINKGVK